MINTALELQAIARVHRIGQYHPTTVWMSLVSHTVEKAIYDISVRRRLAHMAAHRKDRSHDHGCDEDDSQHGHGHDAPVPERALEAANSRSLQDAPLARLMAKETGAGELVDQADLWLCLFSAKPLGLKPIGDDVLGEPAEDGMEESAENG
jgi:E3 ubiquitin-protein ligase SHPRH